MTAINITCRRRQNQIMVMTDGAHYTPDGLVQGISAKGITVPSWPGFIVGRGPTVNAISLGAALAVRLPDFDDAIDHIETVLPQLVEQLDFSQYGASPTIELVLAGFSKQRSGPECYLIRTTDDLPPGMTREDLNVMLANGHGGLFPQAYELTKLGEIVTAPIVDDDMRRQSGYLGVDPDESDSQVETDMMMAIECQRQQRDPGHGDPVVGGLACLTKITPAGIEQRIMKRWDDDVVGEYIDPQPVDWKAWKAARTAAAVAAIDTTGMSRMQRERMEKKARKGTLRAV